MLNRILASLLALLVICALPALALAGDGGAAGDAEGMSTQVKWAAGILGFVGFILGSVPFDRYNYGSQFDMGGAVVGALAGALVGGGVAEMLTTGVLLPGIFAAGFGALLIVIRVINMMAPPPRR